MGVSNRNAYTFATRGAESGAVEHWTTVAVLATRDAVPDELAAPAWPRAHGDIVRVTGAGCDELFVFDRVTDTYLAAPAPFTLAFWEGDGADAEAMLRACERVDRRRLVLAACACARTVLHLVPAGEDRPRVAIETAERWARGEATLDEVQRAREAAWGAYYDDDATAATYAAAYAAAAATAVDYTAATATATARALAPIVRAHIPLSVAVCAALGLSDPLPIRWGSEIKYSSTPTHCPSESPPWPFSCSS